MGRAQGSEQVTTAARKPARKAPVRAKTTKAKGKAGAKGTSSKPRTRKMPTDPTKPLLADVRFKQEYRCFTKGQRVSFRPGVNLLVGEQGAGKSSLLGILRQMGDRFEMTRDRARETIAITAQACPMHSFDFEKENVRTQSSFGDNIGFQVASMFASHGETTNAMLGYFRKEFSGEREQSLILLDEPDMALSPRSAHLLANIFEEIGAAGHQVIASVHNPIVIASQRDVLSLEHDKWMTSEAFLNAHAA